MSDKDIWDDFLEYGSIGLIISYFLIFIILPGEHPKLSILIVPVIALLFLAGNVPNWIIVGWIVSGGVWFTIPIWAPLLNGDEPFTKPN